MILLALTLKYIFVDIFLCVFCFIRLYFNLVSSLIKIERSFGWNLSIIFWFPYLVFFLTLQFPRINSMHSSFTNAKLFLPNFRMKSQEIVVYCEYVHSKGQNKTTVKNQNARFVRMTKNGSQIKSGAIHTEEWIYKKNNNNNNWNDDNNNNNANRKTRRSWWESALENVEWGNGRDFNMWKMQVNWKNLSRSILNAKQFVVGRWN